MLPASQIDLGQEVACTRPVFVGTATGAEHDHPDIGRHGLVGEQGVQLEYEAGRRYSLRAWIVRGSLPSTSTEPVVGMSSAAMRYNMVDFPHPDEW